MKGKVKMSEYWLRQKKYNWNNARLIFIIVGCFYKTYETDAEFLNKKLGLRIMEKYSGIICMFPIKKGNKYFEFLRESKYSFSIFDIIEGKYMRLIDEYNGGNELG